MMPRSGCSGGPSVDLRQALAQQIRARLGSRGENLTILAARAGCSRGTLHAVLRGSVSVGLERLAALAAALDATPADLLDRCGRHCECARALGAPGGSSSGAGGAGGSGLARRPEKAEQEPCIVGARERDDEPIRQVHRDLARNLTYFQARSGFESVGALALAAGISKSQIYTILKGQGNPRLCHVVRLGMALLVSPADLVCERLPWLHDELSTP